MASTAQQLRGSKAVAVKTVSERMPSSILSLLLQHVGSCGDYESSALSDDILSTKRIYPGFLFRSTITKDWNLRGRVTEESMESHAGICWATVHGHLSG